MGNFVRSCKSICSSIRAQPNQYFLFYLLDACNNSRYKGDCNIDDYITYNNIYFIYLFRFFNV